MADIVFKYSEMGKAVADITALAEKYKTSAVTFQNDFLDSIKDWEGESKEQMVKFISGPVMEYARDTIPQLLTALAELLDGNIKQMKSADEQIAANIPTSLG